MTIEKIGEWCGERINLKRKDDYYDNGRRTEHVVKFENGDTYEQTAEYDIDSNFKQHIKIYLNGKLEYDGRMIYENYGWREMA